MKNEERDFQIVDTALHTHPLNKWVKVMVVQPTLRAKTDYTPIAGLYYPTNLPKFKAFIYESLFKAKEEKVKLLVFPELAIPRELVPFIENWSKGQKNMVIIAGSHYVAQLNGKPIAQCPVIYNGRTHYSDKIVTSRPEFNPNKEAGLGHGNKILLFDQTPIGRFMVLICSDNLSHVSEKIKHIDLDFLIIIACQDKSDIHRDNIKGRIKSGFYQVYANCLMPPYADGKSSFWGKTDPRIKDLLKKGRKTDFKQAGKLCELKGDYNCFLLKVNIREKEPKVYTGVNTEYSNIDEVELSTISFPPAIPLLNQPLEQRHYVHINEQLCHIQSDPACYQLLVEPAFIQQIKANLDIHSIVFVTGPIQVGKTTLLKVIGYALSYGNESAIDIICSPAYPPGKITDIQDLYYWWYHEITHKLLRKMDIEPDTLDIKIRQRIEHLDVYKEFLEQDRNPGDNYLQAFLQTIQGFKNEVDQEKRLLASFRLDDIHKYIDDETFRKLKGDLVNLNEYTCDDQSVKLIIASRYLPAPASLKRRTVIFLDYLTPGAIHRLSELFRDEMDTSELNAFTQLICKKTDGYPWFVMRFLSVYLQYRMTNLDTRPALELAQAIFAQGDLWTQDKGSKNPSMFLQELQHLIDTADSKAKRDFKNWIMLPPNDILLNNSWNNINDLLIRQSGFFKIDTETDTYLNNGCELLTTFFKDQLEING